MSFTYTLIGHLTADLLSDGRMLGGTVAYAAAVGQAFGCRVQLHTSARADDPLLAEIGRYGTLQLTPADQTTTFENHYHAGQRTQYIRQLAAPLSLAGIQGDFVHLAPIAAEIDPLQVLDLPPEITLLVTPQGWLRQWDASGQVTFTPFEHRRVLQRINYMILSQQDIAAAPELEALYAAHVPQLIVTDGAAGGIYYRQGQAFPYTAIPTVEVDPTGAGDVFAAAFFASLPQVGQDPLKALHVARQLAAISVTRRGVAGIITAQEALTALQAMR